MDFNFNSIYTVGCAFFKKIVELDKQNNYDYMILTTRRCFCLFFALYNDEEFKTNCLYKSNDFDFEYFNRIIDKTISSQSIDINGDDFKHKKILLLDDIMIHGHAVYELFEKLNGYQPNKVDTLIMIRNIEFPDFYYMETKQEYSFVERLVNPEWREISNLIVKYLHTKSEGYISYIFSIKTQIKRIVQAQKEISELEKIDIDFKKLETYQEYNSNCYPDYYFVNLNKNYSFIKYALFRVYRSNTGMSEDCYVVPFIQLKNMTTSMIDDIWNSIWASEQLLCTELSKIKTSEDRYKALTAICSIVMYQNILGSINMSESIIDKSYFPGFLNLIIESIDKDILFEKIEILYSDVEYDNEENLMTQLLDVNADESFEGFSDFIRTYFYIVTEKEESLYQTDNKFSSSQNMLLLSCFIEKIQSMKLKESYAEVVASMMFLADIGVLSFVINKNCNNIVATYIKTGEQSYHLFASIAGCAFTAIFVLLNYLNSIKNEGNEHYKNGCKTFLTQFNQNLFKDNDCPQLKKYKAIIYFFVKYPPTKLSESYYGALFEWRNSTNLEIARDILKNVMRIMRISGAKGIFI